MNISINSVFRFINYRIITCMILTFIVAAGLLIWRYDSLFPNSLDWDLYAHMTLYHSMLKGNISILPSQISDTFLINAYTPVFSLFLGLGKAILFFLSIPAYFYIMNSFYFIGTVLLSGLVGYHLYKSKWMVVISSLFGAFIFESVIAQTSFFFVPQGVVAGLNVIAILLWLQNRSKTAFIISVISIPMHYFIGIVGLGLLILLTIIKRLLKIVISSEADRRSYLIILGIIIFVSVVILSTYVSYNPFGSTESELFQFSLIDRINYIVRWYSALIIFYPIGIIFIFKKSNEPILHWFAYISLIMFSLIFLPIPYTFKMFTIGRYFINAVIAFGVFNLITNTRRRDNFTTGILLIPLSLVLGIVLYFNTSDFKEIMTYGSSKTTVSANELNAANFLKEKYGKTKENVLLVSDPATQHVLEGLSGINTQGGAFANHATRSLLATTYPYLSGETVFESITQVQDSLVMNPPSKYLFAVSGRFISWSQLADTEKFSEGYNIWASRDLTPMGYDYISDLRRDDRFNVVFQNPAMAIFEINND